MVTAAITATGVILSLSATIAWMSYNAGLNDCQAYDGIVIGYGQTAFISTITYLFSRMPWVFWLALGASIVIIFMLGRKSKSIIK